MRTSSFVLEKQFPLLNRHRFLGFLKRQRRLLSLKKNRYYNCFFHVFVYDLGDSRKIRLWASQTFQHLIAEIYPFICSIDIDAIQYNMKRIRYLKYRNMANAYSGKYF